MTDSDVLLKVENLRMYFPIFKGIFRRVVGHVKAVDGVEFYIKEGETLGLVGESGCGKSTTGRCIVKLCKPTTGSILFRRDGDMRDLIEIEGQDLLPYRREIQIIFQDPFSSLDNRMTVRDVIAEPLKIHRMGSRDEQTERVVALLEKVGMNAFQLYRYPHEFSGGQRQRIGIARALALNPRLIICDEPVSALDVSVQAQVLNLLEDMQLELKLTFLFIAHDLSVVEHISDRVMVMYLGKIVEIADSDSIYMSPRHPYTEALLMSIPASDPREFVERMPLQGTVPDPANPPPGCNFSTRCPYVRDICRKEEPELKPLSGDNEHFAACHLTDELSLTGYEQRLSGQIKPERADS